MDKDLEERGSPGDDISLLHRIAAGEQGAMVALFDRHSTLVYAVALRVLNDPAGAEDVMQDVFLRIWRKPPAIDAPLGSLAGWFSVLARNRAIDQLRRRRATDAPEDVVLVSATDVEKEGEHTILLARARSMMQALPEEQQAVLNLAFFDGLTHSEIAAKLHSPLGTIKTRLRRAVLTLRKAAQG